MKKQLLLFFVLLITLQANAQSVFPKNSREEADRIKHKQKIKKCGAASCIIKTFNYENDSTDNEGFICNIFNYDTNGNLILEKRYDVKNGPATTYKYHFNPQDLLVREEVINIKGEVIRSSEYTYDNQGNLISEISYDTDTKVRKYKSKYTYVNGVRKTITIADSTDTTIKIIEIASNDDGYASQISEFRADHTLIFITDYIYDTNGNCTGIIETDRIGQKSSILFKYDTAGNLTEETYHASNGKSYLKYSFEYDTAGNLIKQIEIDARGNISSITEYIYNHFGLLIKETWYDPHNNPRSVIEYTYKPY